MAKKAVLAGALTAFNGSWKRNQAHSEREQTHSRLCHSPGFSAKTIQMTKLLIKDQIGLEIKVFINILLLKPLNTRHSANTV
jgi:hypothetical protein